MLYICVVRVLMFFFSSRRRHTRYWRGLEFRRVLFRSIGLAGVALLVMSVLRDFVLATAAAFCVGLFAGVSWIIGYTLIGFEVEDRLRGRVFAFVISSVRIVQIGRAHV